MSLSLLQIAALLLQAALLQTPATTNAPPVSWESNVVEKLGGGILVFESEIVADSSGQPTPAQTSQNTQQVQEPGWGAPAWAPPKAAVPDENSLNPKDVTTPWANSPEKATEAEGMLVRGLNEVPAWDAKAEIDFANASNSGLEIVNRNADHAEPGKEPPPWRIAASPASFQEPGAIIERDVEDLYSEELDQIEPADLNDPELEFGKFRGLDGKSVTSGRKPEYPRGKRENPSWWIQALQQPLLSQRQVLPTNIDEVMFVALKNSPQVQILNARPIIQETFVGEADAQFDWTQFVETTWNETDEPVGSSLTTGSGGRFFEREWTLDAGLRRQLRNGGTFSFTQRYGTLDNNSDFLDPQNQGNSQLFLDYRQPLLRDRGRFVSMSQVALASLDFDAVSGESRTALQEYLVSVVRSYWNVYFRRAALVISRRGLQRGKELLRQLRLRDGIDVRNDQLLRAEAAVASRRSDVIRAEYELVNAQDELINVSVGPKYLAGTPEQVEFMPVAFDLPLGIQFDPTTVAQSAVYNRPEVQQSIAQLRAAAIRNQVSQNQILPRLDAVLTTTVNGLRGNKDIGGAFSDQFSAGNPSYSAGFEFEIPVGNRAAQYRAERAQMEMSLAHREFESQVGDVLVDARIASREVSRLNSENQNNWAALLKANEELFLIQERQRLQLDDGKVGSLYIEDLLASQARLTAAEIRLAQSQTEQAVALVDLKRAVGVLVSGGHKVARPVTFSPSFVPGSDMAQSATPASGGWQAGVQFDSQVLPAVENEPVSNYPLPNPVQPVSNIETVQQGMFVADSNGAGWQQPVSQPQSVANPHFSGVAQVVVSPPVPVAPQLQGNVVSLNPQFATSQQQPNVAVGMQGAPPAAQAKFGFPPTTHQPRQRYPLSISTPLPRPKTVGPVDELFGFPKQ